MITGTVHSGLIAVRTLDNVIQTVVYSKVTVMNVTDRAVIDGPARIYNWRYFTCNTNYKHDYDLIDGKFLIVYKHILSL